MDEITKILIPTYLLLGLFYVPFFFWFRRRTRGRTAQGRFARGVASILEHCEKPSDCASQILTLYKTLTERYEGLGDSFRSAAEMMEDLLCDMDSSDPKQFKHVRDIEPPTDHRNRIVEVLAEIKSMQPYSSISSKEGNLLANLRHAMEAGNKDLGLSALDQLGDDIEVLESSLRRQENRNRLAFTISIVGVILTFFFGFVSFVQFFSI